MLLEIVGRIFNPLGISYHSELARFFDTLIREEPIGYHHQPNIEGTFWGVPVKINSICLREHEIGKKVSGEFRVLALGDSVAFGIGVRYEDTFPHQMELVLNEKHKELQFRVLNMGVIGYNTEQELIQLQRLGLGLQPDAVILMYSANDIEPKMKMIDNRQNWLANVLQRSYAASLLFSGIRNVRRALTKMRASHVERGEYYLGSPRWQAVDRSLTEMNATLRAHRIPFVLFTNNEPPFIVTMLEAVAKREGFPFVNLRRQDDPRWAGQDERLFHNSASDGHPSVLGNHMLGTLIAEHFERLGALQRQTDP